MFAHIKKSLQKIGNALKRQYPERIVSIYAFGSRVRGDYREGSDIDLLIVVKDKEPGIEKDIIDLIVEEEIKGGVSFTPVIKDSLSFKKEKIFKTPFYENIIKEGIAL
jgi:predicted nucleotidyltransferase